LGMDEKVRSLVERQEAVAQETLLAESSKESKAMEPAQSHDQDRTSQVMVSLIRDSEEVVARLRELGTRYSHQSAGLPELIAQVLSLQSALKRLCGLGPELLLARLGSSEAKQLMDQTCWSINYTQDDILEALTPGTLEHKWTRWNQLSIRMSQVERLVLGERLSWYKEVVSAMMEDLDHLSDVERMFWWSSLEQSMHEFLERQKSGRDEH